MAKECWELHDHAHFGNLQALITRSFRHGNDYREGPYVDRIGGQPAFECRHIHFVMDRAEHHTFPFQKRSESL